MATKIWPVLIGLLAVLLSLPTLALAARPESNAEIVVTGIRSSMSNWRQAETSHFIMLSDGSEAELMRLARNLERLHFLLAGLMGRGAEDGDIARLHITLIGDVSQFESMNLRNTRWQQGPYSDLFRVARYYDPREDGAVLASARADQRVVVERTQLSQQTVARVFTSMALAELNYQRREDMFGAIGSFDLQAGLADRHGDKMTFGEKDMVISQEQMLYAGYAQNFLLTYFPSAYPRWYLDGFGQIFATMELKGSNVLDFGRVPNGAATVMHNFGPYPLNNLLDDSYLTQPPSRTRWTPVHAWMMTHFLMFSDAHRRQLRQYLAARAQGVEAVTAAKIFGDTKQFSKDLGSYFYNRKPYLEISYDPSKIEEPLIRRLRESEAAFIKGRLELGARIEIPPTPNADTPPDVASKMTARRNDALGDRQKWLTKLRSDAGRWPNELGAQLLLAEAECRSGNAEECLAAARRAEIIAPSDARPKLWAGLAMVKLAALLPASERAPMLAAGRAQIIGANQADHEAIGPLLAYYASFVDVGETPSVSALDGLQKAMEEVPSAPVTRLALATALVKRGQIDAARPVILPVALGAYDSPERTSAQVLVAKIDASRHVQTSQGDLSGNSIQDGPASQN